MTVLGSKLLAALRDPRNKVFVRWILQYGHTAPDFELAIDDSGLLRAKPAEYTFDYWRDRVTKEIKNAETAALNAVVAEADCECEAKECPHLQVLWECGQDLSQSLMLSSRFVWEK